MRIFTIYVFFLLSQVVEKRLWKDVLRSFNPSATNPSSASLRTVQEYYVKMLLPYECVISNINIRDCLVQYETSRRVSTESVSSPSSHSSGKDQNQTDQFRTQTDRVNCNTTLWIRKTRGGSWNRHDQRRSLRRVPDTHRTSPGLQLTELLDHGRPAGSGEGRGDARETSRRSDRVFRGLTRLSRQHDHSQPHP